MDQTSDLTLKCQVQCCEYSEKTYKIDQNCAAPDWALTRRTKTKNSVRSSSSHGCACQEAEPIERGHLSVQIAQWRLFHVLRRLWKPACHREKRWETESGEHRGEKI